MDSIADVWGFSDKTPISPSGGFSVETLIEVSLLWKAEYPDGCSTAIRRVARKVATMKGRLVSFGNNFTMEM